VSDGTGLSRSTCGRSWPDGCGGTGDAARRRHRQHRLATSSRTRRPDHAAPHGVVGLTRALAFLKDEANIRVNCVCPSFVDTPLPRRRLESMSGEERTRLEGILARIPMIPPSEVADAVLEIVRDGSLAGQAMALQYGQPRRLIPPSMSLM
jgi:NAD(P)-dependent dehydrogenase (short-subunit alcohol dehydrogenase family)